MNDFETVPCGTEQALREALELLGIKVEGSPVEAWRRYKRRKEERSDWIWNVLGNDLEGRN